MRNVLAAVLLMLATANAALAARPITDRYDDTFRKYSKRLFGPGFEWRIFKAQAMAESNLDPSARSRVGARGMMQLMPTTFREVHSKNPEFGAIGDPEWNIASGIYYDRQLWQQWDGGSSKQNQREFMFGSYNAGRGTLLRAQDLARDRQLDPQVWDSIETVAPTVPRWRHKETLGYIEKIQGNIACMDEDGRVVRDRAAPQPSP